MSKLMKFTFKLLDLMVIFVMAFGSPMAALAQEAGPTLATDKTDYAPGEIISISGNGFVAGSYSLIATYPDRTTMEWGPVTVDESLLFAATSPAVTAEGDYSLAVYNEGSDTVIANIDFKVVTPIPEPTIEPTTQPTAEPTVGPPATPTPEPIIQSDKADYAPGEAVTLTGRFWQAGETIRIFVNDDIWNSWYHDASINADDAGTFTYTFQLPNWFVATYSVKATGSVSGLVTTSFTDSQEDYKHYADKSPANWQNGALQSTNSQYFEGEVVPHYWKTESLTPGQTYGINIYYDYFDTSSGGYCGFDYLTQYNISRYPPAVGSSPYPIASLPGVSGSLFTVGAGNVSTSGPYNAGIQRFIQVRFIAATSKVEFYWGLHLAQPGVISGCQGSKAWPGASLQSDVRAVPQFTQYMLGGGGSMQINPSAVIRGTISGFKWNDLDGDGAVDGNESKLSGWTIRLCYDSGCTGVIQTTTTDASGNYNFNVAPGTYFVREVQQPGWSQTWTPSGYYGPLTITATTPTYSNINFGNRQGSSITIVKDAVPNDPQDFPFYGTFGGFLLDDDSDSNVSNSRTYSNLSPGVYTVGENPMGYWDFSGIKCTGDNGNTIVYPGSTQVQIYLDAGENIVCTFTNTKRGTIIINKFTSGGDGTFGFTTTGGNSFPSSFNITTVNGSGSQTFSNVAAGAYSISETTLQGWDLTKAACSTGTPDSFTVEPGGTVTCSFTNMLQMGTLIVKKVVVNDNGGSKGFSDFSFKVNGATAIPFEEDGQNNLNINAGTYTVTEPAVAGYTTTYDNCTDVIVPAGGSATCTITNDDQPGTLIVKKVVVNDNGGTLKPENFTFAVNGDAPVAFEADGENTLTVNAGTYTVTEPVVAGYTTTYENCTDIAVPNGGTVICTITNNDNAGTLTVKKIVINDNGGTLQAENFTFAVNGGDAIAFEEDGENQLTINAGIYNVTETAVTGYTTTYDNCSNVVIANGGSATCTITNNDQPGTLIIKKVVINDNGGTLAAKDFSFVVNDMATVPFETDGQNDLIVDAGTYTIVEAPITGYTATYSNCDDVIVPNGGSQTCVITNDDQAGTIIVEKQTDPDGLAGEFIFTGDAAGTISDNGQIVVSALSAGTYISSEVVPAGWQLTGISCNDTNSTGDVASSTATFNLENGETVKCVFTNDPLPTVTLTKTASPTTLPEPGGLFTFTLQITNTSAEPVTITGLGDSNGLSDQGTPECKALVGKTLMPNESVSCSYGVTHTEAGTYVNTAEVTVADEEGNAAGDTDSETVIVADVPPSVNIVKTASPLSLPEPGGAFTFTLTITNESVEEVTITSLTDDNALSAECLALIDTKLAAKASTSCTYTVTHIEAGSYPNTANVTVKDNENNPASDSASETVAVTDVSPVVVVTKLAYPTAVPETGANVTFTFVVKNMSVEPVTITSLSDSEFGALVGNDGCQVGTVLPVDGSCTIIEIHFIKGDYEGGIPHNNVFTAHAEDNEKNDISASDDATVNFTDVLADIAIVKVTVYGSTSGDGMYILTGEAIKWRYTVTNLGNYSLSNVSVTDSETGVTPAFVGGDTNSNGKLDTTEVWIYEASGTTITGNYSNIGTAYGDFADGAGNIESDTATDESSYFGAAPHISLTKSITEMNFDEDGDVLNYTLVATNDGNVPLTDVSISDPLLGFLTCTPAQPATLAPTETLTCTGTYTTLQDDVDAGKVDNIASTSGTYATTTVTDTASATIPAIQNPALTLEKTGSFDAGADGYADAGELITYTFVVTNVGNVTLHNATVTDPLAGLSAITCNSTTTPVDGHITCTATYAVTQADIDAGSVYNLATADSKESEPDDDDNTQPLPQNPLIQVVKSSTTTNISTAGQVVPYTFTVTNEGNVTLTGITVTDPNCDAAPVYVSGDTNTDTKLQLAETWIYTCDHTVTQAEIDTYGPSSNLALGANPSESDSGWGGGSYPWDITDGKTSYSDTWAHGLAFTGGTSSWMGQACGYRQATLDFGTSKQFSRVLVWHHGMEHVPTIYGVDYWNGTQWLPAGGSSTLRSDLQTTTGSGSVPTETIFPSVTGSKVRFWMNNCNITHGWIYEFQVFDANGMLLNTVTADSSESPSDTDDHNIPITYNPALSIEKTGSFDAGADGYANIGELITYTFVVTNTGNVTLHNVTVTDPLTGLSAITCDGTAISVGGHITCNATYAVTQTDIDKGSVYNKATADSTESGPDDDDNTEPLPQNPAIQIEKFSSLNLAAIAPSDRADAGDKVLYTFTVTNTGNVTLHNVVVIDAKAGVTCNLGTMAPGAVDSTTCTGSYTLTQADIDAGKVHNQAFANGTGPQDQDVTDDDENDQPIEQQSAVTINKVTVDNTMEGDSLNILTGETISWKYAVQNTGNVTLTDVTVTDDKVAAATIHCSGTNVIASLAPDETVICTATGTAITGPYTNNGSVNAKPPFGNNVTASDASSYFGANPQLTIDKVTVDGATEGDGLYILTGETIGWKYTVTNTGNVVLDNMTVTDSQNVAVSCPKATLAIGESMICTASGTAITGSYTNSGTASGSYTDSVGHSRTDTETDTSSYFGADPQIAIAKATVDGSTSGDALNVLTGESIKWRYTITNVGNIPLSHVTVTDSKSGVTPVYVSGDTNNNSKLDLTEAWIFEATGTAIMGAYENIGTTEGGFTDSNGDTRFDSARDGSSYFGADPQLTILKVTVDDATSGDGLNILTGEAISWKYTVTNTGNVTLSNVSVTDSKGVAVTCPKTSLAIGESMDCTATGTAMAGNYSNIGTVKGTYTDSAGHSRTDTETDTSSYFGANPQINIVKKTIGSDGSEGDNVFVLINGTVTWKYYVTNTGNVTLSNVVVTDNQPGVTLNCPKTTLAVGESMTCTASGANTTPIGTWYNNTGTATGTYTDSASHSRTATDSDTSAYYSQAPGEVTNSSLCDFGTNFTLVFTPDVKFYTSSTPAYKLSDSNPGQFFYNVFQIGGTGTVTLTLPYPYVTQGATPIHVYRNLTAVTNNGQTCLQPTNEIKNYQQTVTLSSYPANNYAGKATVTLTGLPTTGFMYINIHMDYGLEKLNGWVKQGSNANYNATINPTMPKVNIVNNTAHTFTSSIPNSTDTIYNSNSFKSVKGFGGLVMIKTKVVDGVNVFEGLKNAKIELRNATGKLIETMYTDENGWYLSTYIPTGKSATFTVKLIGGSGNVDGVVYVYTNQSKSVTTGGSNKFGEGAFEIIP